MSKRDSKHVNFMSTANDSRSRHSRDSGLGSSTEHAHAGGMSTRGFTAQDFETQRWDVGALQEALGTANQNLREQKKKNLEMDEDLSIAHKSLREKEAIIRGLYDENTALKEQVKASKDDIDNLRDENAELTQRILTYSQHIESPVMSGAGHTGHSADTGRHSKSKTKRDEDKAQNERLKQRIKPPGDDASSSTTTKKSHRNSREMSRTREASHRSSHGRRSSISVSNRTPYIEEPDDRSYPPVSSKAAFDNLYTSAPAMAHKPARIDTMAMSNIPRTTPSIASPTYPTNAYHKTGDYVPVTLPPDPRGRRR